LASWPRLSGAGAGLIDNLLGRQIGQVPVNRLLVMWEPLEENRFV
jgi:hypothetical protein